MYKADISPVAAEVLNRYVRYCARLRYIPDKYRVLNFWSHLWFVFQVYEKSQEVKIEYIIDDWQNYGTFIN